MLRPATPAHHPRSHALGARRPPLLNAMRTATLRRARSLLPPALDALTLPPPPAASYSTPIALRRVLKRLRVARGASPLPTADASPALTRSESKPVPLERQVPARQAKSVTSAAVAARAPVACPEPAVSAVSSHTACIAAPKNTVEVDVGCEPERLFTGAFVIDVGSPYTTDCESGAGCDALSAEKGKEVESTGPANCWPSSSVHTSLAGGMFGCFLMFGAWRHAIPLALLGR